MAVPPVVSQLLRATSPTLLAALALPPPLNALASAIASAALARFASGPGGAPLTPDEVTKVIESHASDPGMVPALRQAEVDLKRYEDENRFRFAELEARDRQSARDFQVASGIGDRIFTGAIWIVGIALAAMLAMIAGLLYVVLNGVPLDPDKASIAVAAFGLIGTAVGFVNGLAATVVAYYWGSSQGSKEKGEALSSQVDKLSDEIGKVAQRGTLPETPSAPAEAPEPEAKPAPTTAAKLGDIVEELRRHAVQHRHFEGSVTWALTPEGISVEGAKPMGTTGAPNTVKAIWEEYGVHCAAAARDFTVPVELIVATIATESSGKPDAVRKEAKDTSYGLMQTLLMTAREALGDERLSGQDLLRPETSIRAGTAFIVRQRNLHKFDPVLVAAAYNAGSPRHADFPGNRWRLYCYPPQSGDHLNRFVGWFNDAMALSRSMDWSAGGTPTFVAAFAAAASDEPAKPGATGTLTTPDDAAQTSAAATATLGAVAATLPIARIGAEKPLAVAVQQKLTEHGYLDPPPDGDFRSVSLWAIAEFCKRNGLPADVFGPDTARTLLVPRAPLAQPRLKGDWIDRVIDYMNRNGHWYSRFPGCRNIVYLEGADEDGAPNEDTFDQFNDLRAVFWFDDDGEISHREWQATTEPGAFYTNTPMNPKGAARIKFGQYKAWQVGVHNNDHEALTQAGPVTVHRDLNKDGKRTGDALDTGSEFMINQHHGWDTDRRSIKKTSAGCLVGRKIEGHREFMEIVKQDPRFRANSAYRFVATILPADKVL